MIVQELERWLKLMDAAAGRKPPLEPLLPDEKASKTIRQAIGDAKAAPGRDELLSIVRNLDLKRGFGEKSLTAYIEGEEQRYDAPLAVDELRETGEVVFENRSTYGADLVYRLDGRFHAVHGFEYVVGVGKSDLEDVLYYDFYVVGPETERVWCSLLSREELIDRLEYDQEAESVPFEVNGETWAPPPTARTITEKGKAVFSLLEEDASGLWGMYVYRYGSAYYTYDMADDCILDQYTSLRDALGTEDDRFLTVTPVTESVESSELSFEELTSLLVLCDPLHGEVEPESITVNGRRWPPAATAGDTGTGENQLGLF